MANYRIPEGINMFKVYDSSNQVRGVTGEIEIPEFAEAVNTISASGMLGEYEASMLGQFPSMAITIPFAQLDEQEFFQIIESEEDLTLRAMIQTREIATSRKVFTPLSMVVGGPTKSYKLGVIKRGAITDSSITKEVHRMKIIVNNVKCLDYDKFNMIYVVNGRDMFADIRGML